MKVIISDKIYVYNASSTLSEWCKENLVITNPTYATMLRLGKEEMIARKHIPEQMKLYVEFGYYETDLILPFGVLYAIWDMIKDSPYELKFNDNGQVIDRNLKITMPLFDYQEEAVRKMLQAKGGILEGACGCGKTQIGIEIIKRIGKNALWLCHTGDLLRQTVERIHKLYPSIPVGTITEGEVKMVTNGITVSTVQTLVNIDSDIYRKRFDVVMTDEVQHCSSSPTLQKMFGKIIEKIAARYKYGLSATPERADTMTKSMYAIVGCNMEGEFEPVYKISKDKTNTLTAKHIRVELDTPWTYDVLDTDGSFDFKALIDYLTTNEERNEAIINNIIKTLETHKKQVVLCTRVEQCELLNEALQKRGVKSVLLLGRVTKKRRQEILTGTSDWNVIIGTVQLCKEGLDVPELSCLHWASVISDKVAVIQSAGRVERVFQGKPAPEIYDYVDINFPYCLGKYKKRVSFLKRR